MLPEKTKNVPYLDGWRGAAILCVLVGHFVKPFGGFKTSYFGPLGVMLFFVLSGFLMGRILFVKKTKLIPFFVRRFIRIVPTMWVYLTGAYFYSKYLLPNTYSVPIEQLIPTYLFLSTYFPMSVSVWANCWPNGHIWSLNVEEHCYVYLAFGSFMVAKFKDYVSAPLFLLTSLAIVFIFTILYLFGLIHSAVASPFRTHTEVASLGLLASAAYVALNFKGMGSWWSRSAVIPIVTLAIAIRIFVPRYSFTEDLTILVAPLLAAIAINHSDNFPLIIKRILSVGFLRWFGRCSFSIYLCQQPFFFLCLNNGFNHVYGIALGVILGTASFYIVENPSRKFLTRIWTEYEQKSARHLPVVA